MVVTFREIQSTGICKNLSINPLTPRSVKFVTPLPTISIHYSANR